MVDKRVITILKWVALGVGCLAKFASGSLFVFNVYQNALKYKYNYTQSEAEVLSSLLNIGLGVGFVPGMVFDRFGPTLTSAIGLFITTGGYMLIWSTTKSIEFYKTKSWLVAIYFFIGGHGSLYTYMAALNTNVMNFSAKYRGTVIGILNAFFAGSPAAFALVYYNLFANGENSDDSQEDYPGFMLMIAIVFAVVNLLCIIFLKVHTKDETGSSHVPLDTSLSIQEASPVTLQGGAVTVYTSEKAIDSSNIDGVSSSNIYDVKDDESVQGEKTDAGIDDTVPFLQLIKDVDFHLLIWFFAFATTSGLVTGNNITTSTKSLHNSSHDQYVVLIIPLTNLVVSFSMGMFSDKIKSRIPRRYFLVCCAGCYTSSAGLLTLFVDYFPVFIIATVFSGIATGIVWSIVPTYLSELFGVKTFGRNWGILLILASLMGFAGQAIFGAIYDSKIDIPGEVTCYGVKCVQGGYGTILAMNSVALVLIIVFAIKRRRRDGAMMARF